MNRTVSATQARIHFGEIMRRARTEPVIVERDGKPEVVVISKKEYDQLVATAPKPDWRKMVEETHALIRAELKGRTLPPPEEMLRQAREERDEQLLNSLR
ncbi:MAG: type II toxin-antitoxin system Phd/YefM family antitoxin [Anaerolineae bacterium CG17_big_fil_post_rev_8_21_14_2_50_57_27]|jgi:prevent-host-death family protein|nr:MAG: type II toxin-antitoxin system Phd/YefM family antitoxin [Anaerolineae bacterium CG06_land_8_20_14_3_00_57_67]PIW18897.1 MAG: type II toxin-antitoxin system Phd/YefM family antitoxin [Anaerolineae bacterium CG17_big_fil_post_rev_8_21_14_2_50_57_27]